MDRGSVVADLKIANFTAELQQGWQIRCIYLGRQMADTEPLAQLPNGAFLHCYLQRAQGVEAEPEFPPDQPDCKQNVVFHAMFAAALAMTWGAYFVHPDPFDYFSCTCLWFFSIVWPIVVCEAFLRCRAV